MASCRGHQIGGIGTHNTTRLYANAATFRACQVLMPATRLSPINKFRLYNLVPEGHTGRPGYYVIHT